MSETSVRKRSVLRERDFRMLFGAHLVSETGTQVSMIALPLVALLTLEASPFQVGLLFTAQTAAFAALSLPAGVWVDRLPRRPTLIVSDLVRAALLGSIPVAWAAGALTLVQLYVVALGTSSAKVFFDLAYQSYLPTLVARERLVDGNTKLEIVNSAAQVGGPGIGGWLVSLVSAPAAVVVDAVSFLLSAAFLGRIRVTEVRASSAHRPGLVAEIREGLRFVIAHPILRVIALRSSLANLAFAAVVAVQTVFLIKEVGLSAGVFGTLLSSGAVGGLVGGLLIGPLTRRVGTGRLMWVAPLVCQPFALLIPFTGHGAELAYFVVGSFVEGIGIVLYNVSQLSFRQAITPREMLGRMNATMRFVVWGTMPLGSFLGGLAGQVWGVRVAMWVALCALSASVLPMLLSPLVRMRDLPAQPEEGLR